MFIYQLPLLCTICFFNPVMSMNEQLQSTEEYIDLGYATLWCQTWFTESTKGKTPIVFIHGGPGFESGYIINLKEIAHTQPCIFYDQSGCGKSAVKEGATISWNFEHYTKELALLIKKLGLKKLILFGYSWGAALAVQYAYDNPEQVTKLILASPYISTSHLIENYKKRAQSLNIYDRMIAHETAGTTESNEYQDAFAQFFSNFIFRGDATRFKLLSMNKEISDIMWGKNELSVTGNLKDLNLILLLPAIKVPVLLTAGQYDTMTPDYMALLYHKLLNSTLTTFGQSAHMPHIEEERSYRATVTTFLTSNT